MTRAEYAAWRRKNDPEGRTCDHDDRPLYAKGLCWPHYKKLKQTGYIIGPAKTGGLPRGRCEQCGGPRAKAKGGPKGRLCSTCKLARTCVACGTDFTAAHSAEIFCSNNCRPDNYWQWWVEQNRDNYNRYKRSVNSRRRATGPGEGFTHEEIFDRDGWTCAICNQPVDPELKHPDPMSASLDHIIPISQLGPHIQTNVRCTHLDCNVRRHVGNYDDPIQLILV